jgi:hypothetical protein
MNYSILIYLFNFPLSNNIQGIFENRFSIKASQTISGIISPICPN